MEKAPAFVIPAGVVFSLSEDGVVIENRGDIVLHTDFGRTLTRIISHEGAIELHTPATAGTLSARGSITVMGALTAEDVEAGGDVTVGGNGTLKQAKVGGGLSIAGNTSASHLQAGSVRIDGNAQVDQLHATGSVSVGGGFTGGTVRGGDISFTSGNVTARGIQGSSSVKIGAGKVQIDAIIAPEVRLDAKTAGRATVIECQNDVGTTAVKGGFRLTDYEEMFGDPTSFLAERGLNPIGAKAAAAPAPPPPAAPPSKKAAKNEPPPKPAPESDAPTVITLGPAPATPVSPEIEEDLSSTTPVHAATPEHPLHPQLMDAVNKILECYGNDEVPPAVLHLRNLIDTHEYDQVRAEITTIWSDLLKFHQKKGMRIQHQVTNTFNAINSLVKKM